MERRDEVHAAAAQGRGSNRRCEDTSLLGDVVAVVIEKQVVAHILSSSKEQRDEEEELVMILTSFASAQSLRLSLEYL